MKRIFLYRLSSIFILSLLLSHFTPVFSHAAIVPTPAPNEIYVTLIDENDHEKDYTYEEYKNYLIHTIKMTEEDDIKKALKDPEYINVYLKKTAQKKEKETVAKMKKAGALEAKSEKAMFSLVYSKAKTRTKKVTCFLNGVFDKYYNTPQKLLNELLSYIENKDEYTEGNITSCKVSVNTIGSKQYAEFVFTYYTTNAQEKKVTEKAKQIAKKFNQGTRYEKIKKVHDYLCKTITYDKTLKKEGAYQALIHNVSVCNGYALAFQKIMDEMKIPCKYVTGVSFGEGHAWNLVKLDNKWYNIDLTWDDQDTNKISYTYFLKSNHDFKNHTRDKTQIYSNLPMAVKSYSMKK